MCIGLCVRGACCCCRACCNDSCRLAKRVCGVTVRQQVRLSYLALSLVCVLFTLFLMYFVPSSLGFWSVFIHCPQTSGGSEMLCLGVSAVYRISLALAVFYGIVLLLCLLRDECARAVNEGLWCLKVFFVAGAFVALLFVPNEAFRVYAEIAKWIGGVFLLFQVIMLIDVFYLWGEKWVAVYDRGYNAMAYVLIATALALYALAVFITVKNFQWFPCSVAQNTVTAVLIGVQTIATLAGLAPNSSLVTSGAMSVYVAYQTWSGLNNVDDGACNAWYKQNATMRVEMCAGAFFIIAALSYASFVSAENAPAATANQRATNDILGSAQKVSDDEESDGDSDFLSDGDDEDDDNESARKGTKRIELAHLNNAPNSSGTGTGAAAAVSPAAIRAAIKQERSERRARRLKEYKTNYYVNFHGVMALASVYFAMLFTNWAAPVVDSMTWDVYSPSAISQWVKLVCAWVAALLYVWTLVAPRLFPNRNFQ